MRGTLKEQLKEIFGKPELENPFFKGFHHSFRKPQKRRRERLTDYEVKETFWG